MQPLTRAGFTLGLGMGGFIDGIVLHQILGWHHLICKTAHCQPQSIEQLKQQNTQDGFFHFAVWMLTLIGIVMLFKASRAQAHAASGKLLAGGMLAGWGMFNLVEGVVDHQILGIHHVLPAHPNWFMFDMMFLASGVLMLFVGYIISFSSTRPAKPQD